MASCSHPSQLISLVYDNELDAARRYEAAAQIADCPECTHRIQRLERTHEALSQILDEEVSDVDFSDFWPRIERGIAAQPSSLAGQWASRFRLWRMQWHGPFSWHVPAWATAVGLFLFTAAVSTQLPTSRGAVQIPAAKKPVVVALNNQAQIESLSATSTVLVWNEPTSNATVIWVDETLGEGLP